MPQPKAPGRDARRPRPAPGATTCAEVTTDSMIREFEENRQHALKKGQIATAHAASMAKARLCGLLTDKPAGVPGPPVKFDGNYAEAARRVALLLRLGVKELGLPDNKDMQKPDGQKAIQHKPDG